MRRQCRKAFDAGDRDVAKEPGSSEADRLNDGGGNPSNEEDQA